MADDVLSGTTGTPTSVDPDVVGREAVPGSPSSRANPCISALSGVRLAPVPAAAIICGLRGLVAVLARLPFRECWMPCTIEVCL